jgi:ribonuclease VapC
LKSPPPQRRSKAFSNSRGSRFGAFPAEARTTALDAFERFGKGRHPAALNLGDCFAYACARLAGAPLLYKGDDFPQTDIETA